MRAATPAGECQKTMAVSAKGKRPTFCPIVQSHVHAARTITARKTTRRRSSKFRTTTCRRPLLVSGICFRLQPAAFRRRNVTQALTTLPPAGEEHKTESDWRIGKRYDTRCYFNVRSKTHILSQRNRSHRTKKLKSRKPQNFIVCPVNKKRKRKIVGFSFTANWTKTKCGTLKISYH